MATGLSNSSLPPHGQLPPIPADQHAVQGTTATQKAAVPATVTGDSTVAAPPGTGLSTEATVTKASKKESSGALNTLKKIGGGLLKGGRVLGAVVLGIVGYTAGAVLVSVLWMLSQFIPLPKPDEEKMRNNEPGVKEILNAFRDGAMGMYLNALDSGLQKLAGWKDKKEPAIDIKAAPNEPKKTEWTKGKVNTGVVTPQGTGVKPTKDSEEEDQVEEGIPLETINHSEDRGRIGAHRARLEPTDELDDDELLDDDNSSISSESSDMGEVDDDSRSTRSSVSETYWDDKFDED